MRDTDLLRLRLQAALACVSIAALPACDDGAPDAEKRKLEIAKDGDKKGSDAKADAKADSKADTKADAKRPNDAPPKLISAGPREIKDGEFDYFGPPRDPFADHDEEEGCPKGDWCGSPDNAAMFAVQGLEPELACSARIVANPKAEVKNKKGKEWKGFSFDARMQGRLMTTVTEDTRKAKKDDTVCCYHWFEYCAGRPLFAAAVDAAGSATDGSADACAPILAPVRPGGAWSSPGETVGGNAPEISDALAARLAEDWLTDARMEHASIASFARVTLELMALGAPPELLADVQSAAIDEIRHAGRCFALAARYSGEQLEPGALPIVAPREANFVQLALDTFVEGCVGETVAALMASRQARACQDLAVRETLEMISDDEGNHAALAWRTIEWALGEGGEPVALALREAAQNMRAAVLREDEARCTPAASENSELEQQLRAHGRLTPSRQSQTKADAWCEIIEPTLTALLASDIVAEPHAQA